MLNSKSFLSIDFGAGSLKVAEFDQNETGTLRLLQFGSKPLGIAGSQDAARERVVVRALQELLEERGFQSRSVNSCAPGFHVFSKFVKLPPVDAGKVTQIIQYEAQQNVPFPLDEVVWDYQILGRASSGELEVLLVAIKTDIVEGLFKTSETLGFRTDIVDAPQAALTNSFRYNYGDLEGCSMVLDIGAKTSNVLFFEGEKVYARSINIGSNSITQEFAANSKLPFAEAEKFKIAEGFVSLGGAYEEPENPQQAAISKIARQVMTRLHIQVNQTIQFYRGQQGGSAPQRLFLAGGAALMPYTAQFFAEKLNVEVDYLNPFKNVQIDPSINLEELAGSAHAFGEVVGLGLRSVAQCPVEMNLIPKSALKRQQFNQKKPWFIAAVFSIIGIIFALGLFNANMASMAGGAVAEVTEKLKPVQTVDSKIRKEESKLNKSKSQLDEYQSLLAQRLYWGDLLKELRRACIVTEDKSRQVLSVPTGVWVESFKPSLPDEPSFDLYGDSSGAGGDQEGAGMDAEMMARYGLVPDVPLAADPMAGGSTGPVDTNSVNTITVKCRAVNLKHSPSANTRLIDLFQTELQSSEMFDGKNTKLSGALDLSDPSAVDFGFEMTLVLSNPIKLQ